MIVMMLFALVGPAFASNITVANWMNETNQTVKTFYAKGAVEAMTATWLGVAYSNGVPQERIDACAEHIDSINSQFNTYDEAINRIVLFHINNGGKTGEYLGLVVSAAYLNNEDCKLVE